jgi:hypothetical protein
MLKDLKFTTKVRHLPDPESGTFDPPALGCWLTGSELFLFPLLLDHVPSTSRTLAALIRNKRKQKITNCKKK